MDSFSPLTRRTFLQRSGISMGAIALGDLLRRDLGAMDAPDKHRGIPGIPHHKPKAKRVIFLYMSGGPSHLETFDPKPKLTAIDGQPMPASFTSGQPIAQLQGKELRTQGRSPSSLSTAKPASGSATFFPGTPRWLMTSPSSVRW
ncbi:MAG: DUF1501 domain-containing protein [Gemmatales bacterium]